MGFENYRHIFYLQLKIHENMPPRRKITVCSPLAIINFSESEQRIQLSRSTPWQESVPLYPFWSINTER